MYYEAGIGAAVVVFIGTFLTMLAATPLVMRLAHAKDWLAYPQRDRWHKKPVALMGGIAIFASVVLAYTLALFWGLDMPLTLLGASSIMFVAGFIDDRVALSPTKKLTAQALATLGILAVGMDPLPALPLWISGPIIFMWVVGVTNALNLLDNMDGLAGGIVLIVSIFLSVLFSATGQQVLALSALIIAGACAGFLVFNFNPAKIFMGDCGSLFLGFNIAVLPLYIDFGQALSVPLLDYVAPLMLLAVPIFDTALVSYTRTRAGRSILQGGRDHSSHRLVKLGMKDRTAVLTLYGMGALCGSLVFVAFLGSWPFYVSIGAAVIGVLLFGVRLARLDAYTPDAKQEPVSLEATLSTPAPDWSPNNRDEPDYAEALVPEPLA